MPRQQCTVTLSIRETGAPAQRSFLFHVLVDGEVVVSNRSLSAEQSRSVRELSRRYGALFEQPMRQPRLTTDVLHGLGSELFGLWLASAWEEVTARVPAGARRLLVIASDVPDVLNLPWELLRLPGGDFVGFDPKFSVRRLPWPDRQLVEFDGSLRPRPLRILFMACAPSDQPSLDYEKEERCLLQAIAKAGPEIAYDSGDLGTFGELRQRVNEFRPHIVHLTGHGILAWRCPKCRELNLPSDESCRNRECGTPRGATPVLGHFAFEDERGETDLRSSVEIRQQVLAGSGVQCAFVSGCQAGKAPPVAALGGICQGLVGDEVPMAIGWASSVADDVATRFASTFYNTLVGGQSVDRALLQARQAVRPVCEERADPSWTLPVLYSATTQGLLFDPDRRRQAQLPPRPSVVQMPLPGMTEGYAEQFVGRRRELQRLLPGLREGRVQAVLITGLGGAGKSALATRLARKLEADGFVPIPVPSAQDRPLSAARLLDICGEAFLAAGLRDAHDLLRDAQLPPEERLHCVTTALNRGRFVLVLDNFEVNMDETTRRILDKELTAFYTHLLENLSGGSRALITCRYRPAEPPALPPLVREEPLGDLSEAAFLKFMLRDPEVERRYYSGDLPADLLSKLHTLLGGTPRFLGQMRQVLATVTADELRLELQGVALPEGASAGVLAQARQGYCEEIFTARLYGYLDLASRQALSRAAVYHVPVTVAGLAAVAGESPETLRRWAQQWQDRALAYPEPGGAGGELWVVYGLLRGWLLQPERLSSAERRIAERAAGDFLRELGRRDRGRDLGLRWVDCLLNARSHYLAAKDCQEARAVTNRISGFLVRQGLYEELARLNEELLECEEHPGPMNWIGRSYSHRGEYRRARLWLERCLAAAGETEPRQAAVALQQLAAIDEHQGAYAAAREKYERSLAIVREIGDREGEAATWHNLATIDVDQGEYAAAREKSERSLAIKQEIGDRRGEAATWHNLATIDVDQGEHGAAREKLERSLAINQEIGDRACEAATWNSLAAIDEHEGAYAAAREKFERSLAIVQEIGYRAGEATAWHNLATIDVDQGEYAAAREKSERSLAIKQEIGNRAGEAATWHQLGLIDLHQGEHGAAREKLERSLAINQEIGGRAGEAATWHALGVLAAELGHVAAGMRLVALCYLIHRSIHHGDSDSDSRTVSGMASQLSHTQEQLDAMLQEVAEGYRHDRGWHLLAVAFGEERSQ